MARALKSPIADPTYLEFFGMTQPPFAPLSGPSQIFHSDQYSLLQTHLANVTEQSDCLMVICGADGSGKTTLLNRYTTELAQDVSFATFDETCTDGVEFYCAFLRQLGFHDISGSLHELRRITREFLIHRGLAGDSVLLIIDNAHLVSPSIFEQLRWIAETRVEDIRVLSIILAGNSDLPRIMDSPAMRMLKFRSHVDFTIRVYTEAETEDYVRHRLRLAGGADSAKFSNEARQLIYRFTGGTPSLVNMLCNEVLAEAYAQKTRVVTDELVRTVADRHQLVPHVVPLQGKGRRSTDPDIAIADPVSEERIAAREFPSKQSVDSPAPSPATPDVAAKKLLEQISRLSEQIGELKAERKQATKDIRSRDRQIGIFKEQLSRLKAEQKQGQLEVTARDKELRSFEEELGVVQTERDQALLDVSLRDKELSAFEEQLGVVQTERDQVLLDVGLRDKDVGDLTKQIDVLQAEREQVKRDISARDKALDDLREQLDALQCETEQAQQDIRARDKDLGNLRNLLDASQSETEQAQQDISARNKELRDLNEQLDALHSEREQAHLDIAARDEDLRELKELLESQSKETEMLAGSVGDRSGEVRRLNTVLKKSEKALQKSEEASAKLATDLKQEKSAAKRANVNVDKSKAKIEELDRLKSQLQSKVSDLTADLKEAQQQAAEVTSLDKKEAALKQELEDLSGQLDGRGEELAKLESALKESREECESLRSSDEELKSATEAISEKESRIAELEGELASQKEEISEAKALLAGEQTASHAKLSGSDIESTQAARTITSIEVVWGGKVTQVMEIGKDHSRIMIGRSDNSELCLDSKFVSRHHALILITDEGAFIEDLNSFNGTTVNSKAITRCALHPNDKVTVGDFKLRPIQA